jgi:hypothetical protein
MKMSDKVFAGNVNRVQYWDEKQGKYAPLPVSISIDLNFTVAELDDLKKYATKPTEEGKAPRVYLRMKSGKSNNHYMEVENPTTWAKSANKKSMTAAVEAGNDLPF